MNTITFATLLCVLYLTHHTFADPYTSPQNMHREVISLFPLSVIGVTCIPLVAGETVLDGTSKSLFETTYVIICVYAGVPFLRLNHGNQIKSMS
jgi:hypothetical protein